MTDDAAVRNKPRARYAVAAIVLLLLLVMLIALNIGIGSVNLSLGEILSNLFSGMFPIRHSVH